MSKVEFLDILKQSLDGEIDPVTIKQNIEYYDQYIGSNTSIEEERIIDGLGDPRLIAKTIIESERIAREKGKYTGNRSYQRQYYNEQEDENENKRSESNKGKAVFFNNIKWYHKLTLFLVMIAFIAIILVIGRIFISLLFTLGIPIILIILLLSLFRKQ